MSRITRIIVEGADQQGKTQICLTLSEITGWPIVHYGPPSQDFDFHDDYITPFFTISDRNFISEMCYSKLKGNVSRVVRPEDLLEELAPSTLFILADREDDYVFHDRDELYSKDQILKVREIYRDFWEIFPARKIKINPTTENLYKLILDFNENFQITTIRE